MSDNFPIVIDVDEQKVGTVLRQLDVMPGIVNIHLGLGKDRPPTLLPSGPIQHGVLPAVIKRKMTSKHLAKLGNGSVRQTIAQALGQGRTVHYTMLGKILEKTGLSYHSIHSALTKMGQDKTIERIGPGTYRLTKAGERKYLGTHGPKKIHTLPSAYGGEVNNRKGLRYHILSALQQHSYGQSELKNLLVDSDYSSNNMYNVVPKMREEGLIKKDGDTYTITPAGLRAIAPVEMEVDQVSPNQDGDNA